MKTRLHHGYIWCSTYDINVCYLTNPFNVWYYSGRFDLFIHKQQEICMDTQRVNYIQTLEEIRYALQTYNALSESCLEKFDRRHFDISQSNLRVPDAILLRSHNLASSEVPGGVLAIGRAGAAVNNIPTKEMTARGIPVFNTPGANANSVAELTIAAILFLYRNIGPAWDFMGDLLDQTDIRREAEGDKSGGADAYLAGQIEQGKKKFKGQELRGRTLGLIGLGAIGVKVANIAHTFGMSIIWYDKALNTKSALELMVPAVQKQSLDDVLQEADIISLHIPLTPNTKHLLGKERLSQMKRTAVVVNFARKGIVDEEAIVSLLDDETLGGYISDFGCAKHAKILNLPHLGASTDEAEDRCGSMIAEQIIDYLQNGNITNSVNFPEILLARNGYVRICIVNKNIPKMLSGITDILGDANVNIEEILNKSRDDIAYTIIDTQEYPNESVIASIQQLEGVIHTRVLKKNT